MSFENIDFSTCRTIVVGGMYNTSPREGERYFLRALLVQKSGSVSFANMRLHKGFQYPTYRDICSAIGLFSDDAEWVRCMKHASSSD